MILSDVFLMMNRLSTHVMPDMRKCSIKDFIGEVSRRQKEAPGYAQEASKEETQSKFPYS